MRLSPKALSRLENQQKKGGDCLEELNSYITCLAVGVHVRDQPGWVGVPCQRLGFGRKVCAGFMLRPASHAARRRWELIPMRSVLHRNTHSRCARRQRCVVLH